MEVVRPIRVLLVDDHEIVRRGLALFLEGFEDMQLVDRRATARRLCGCAARCSRMWR